MIAASGAVGMATRHKTGSKAKAERVALSERRRERMYKLIAEHPESAEELEARAKAAKASAPLLAAAPARAIRKAEASEFDKKRATIKDAVEDVGTGHTILKLRQPPIGHLADKKLIAGEEIQAADEIALAFFAIDTRGRLQGMTLDRVDGGRQSNAPWPAVTAKAVANYQRWANYWSDRNARYGDPMLEVVIAAVIDERPVRQIALEIGRRHSTVERGLAAGLRDYAARNGMAAKGTAHKWMTEAEGLFVPARTVLLDAVRRAAIER